MPMLDKVLYRVSEHWHDWRLNVHTYDWISARSLGLPADSIDYAPIPYHALGRMLADVPAEAKAGRFVDFGCGLGRVLIVAHHGGFREPLGVEYSPVICERARANLRGLPITIVNSDAAEFLIPADASVFFFYNPFTGKTLETVLDNIHASVLACPRATVCLAYGLSNFEKAATKRAWLVRTKVNLSRRYPRAQWGVYQVTGS